MKVTAFFERKFTSVYVKMKVVNRIVKTSAKNYLKANKMINIDGNIYH